MNVNTNKRERRFSERSTALNQPFLAYFSHPISSTSNLQISEAKKRFKQLKTIQLSYKTRYSASLHLRKNQAKSGHKSTKSVVKSQKAYYKNSKIGSQKELDLRHFRTVLPHFEKTPRFFLQIEKPFS